MDSFSGGFSADFTFINAADELYADHDIGQLPEPPSLHQGSVD